MGSQSSLNILLLLVITWTLDRLKEFFSQSNMDLTLPYIVSVSTVCSLITSKMNLFKRQTQEDIQR